MDINRCRKILEIGPHTSIEDIKRSYRDLVEIWHPDRFSHNPRLREIAEHKLKEVNSAYQFLTRHNSATKVVSETLQLHEKRAYIRKSCHIPTEFIIQNRPFTPYQHMIRDISGSGTFIETVNIFSSNQKLLLSFTLPAFGEFTSVSGEIVRVTSKGIGVTFKISEQYKRLISNII